jgi:hypothetical protein
MYYAAVSLSSILIIIFVRDIYPSVPQVLGGAEPLCGRLDLRSSAFSQETLKILGANSAQEVVLTGELEIFFQSRTTVIVGDQQGERFELDRGGVAAIRMCLNSPSVAATVVHR